ncbi:MAG TPA: KGG domain-containing protein [Moraxellaceae bacterium]|nr:KGG domain-containing protein [Moraxellaceae bacterium]
MAGRKGGQAAHRKGTAHKFTQDEARAAGRKGGEASHGGSNNTH